MSAVVLVSNTDRTLLYLPLSLSLSLSVVGSSIQSPNFKLLRSPRIFSKDSIPPAYVAWRAVRQPSSYSVPGLHRLSKNSSSALELWNNQCGLGTDLELSFLAQARRNLCSRAGRYDKPTYIPILGSQHP
jgi:hypothetical protein